MLKSPTQQFQMQGWPFEFSILFYQKFTSSWWWIMGSGVKFWPQVVELIHPIISRLFVRSTVPFWKIAMVDIPGPVKWAFLMFLFLRRKYKCCWGSWGLNQKWSISLFVFVNTVDGQNMANSAGGSMDFFWISWKWKDNCRLRRGFQVFLRFDTNHQLVTNFLRNYYLTFQGICRILSINSISTKTWNL